MRYTRAGEVFFMLMLVSFLMILVSCNVHSFSCSYDSEPYHNNKPFMEDRFFWICDFNVSVNASCFTYIVQDNQTIQLNPQMKTKNDFGTVDNSFVSVGKFVSVYFRDRNIYEGVNYTANVVCNLLNGTTYNFSAYIVPHKKDLHSINYRLIWAGNNARPIILLLFVAMVVMLILMFIVPREFKIVVFVFMLVLLSVVIIKRILGGL